MHHHSLHSSLRIHLEDGASRHHTPDLQYRRNDSILDRILELKHSRPSTIHWRISCIFLEHRALIKRLKKIVSPRVKILMKHKCVTRIQELCFLMATCCKLPMRQNPMRYEQRRAPYHDSPLDRLLVHHHHSVIVTDSVVPEKEEHLREGTFTHWLVDNEMGESLIWCESASCT